MNRLDVVTGRPIAMIVLAAVMVPLGLASLAGGVIGGPEVVPLAIGVMVLAAFTAVAWLVRRAHARSVSHFTDTGLERNDGLTLSWGDLERVVYQIRTTAGQKRLWRTEIRFRNGHAAWLLPLRIRNGREVGEFVLALPCDHTEEQV